MHAADVQKNLLTSADVETIFRRFEQDGRPRPWRVRVKSDADAFRALVGCLLSAQSRDDNTAKAKNALFKLADTPGGILALDSEKIARAIKPAGLYNVKTRNLKMLCAFLIERHAEVVPRDRAGLMKLPGIGRKCADIMLSFSFGEAVIAVDTHVHRVCNRIGLARGKTEAETARSLEARAPDWAKADGHLWLLVFGKQTCGARAPKCSACKLNDLCLSYRQTRIESVA
ncbi:MAG: endonuclease III domain-containing protein [Geminicoccales bacterium]